MNDHDQHLLELQEEFDALQQRLMELEELEVARISEEQERFDSLQVLDEYAGQLEESRDKLARLFRAATALQEVSQPQAVLQRIADAVHEAGWGSVSVTLLENWEVVMSAYAGCSAEDIEFLETHRLPASERAKKYGPEYEKFRISRSYFIPGDRLQEVMSLEYVLPGRREVQPGDSWDPMDLAYVPLYGSDGSVIGNISCDDPVDGRRPTAETFFYLEIFADMAARKLENARLLEQRKRYEEALRESEEKYRTIFERSADGFFLMDYLYRDCNTKACELFGATREQIIGHSPAEFSPEFQPDGRLSTEAAQQYIRLAFRGQPQTFPWIHRKPNGTLLHCEISLSTVVVNDELMVFAIIRDITERHRTDIVQQIQFNILEAASVSENLDELLDTIRRELGRLVDTTNFYVALYDPQEDNYSFPYFVDEMDDPPIGPEMLQKSLTDYVRRSGQPILVDQALHRELEAQGEARTVGTPSAIWMGVPLKTAKGVIGVVTMQSYRDPRQYTPQDLEMLNFVSGPIAMAIERKRADEKLRESEKRYRALVESSPDAIFLIQNGCIVFANPAAINLVTGTDESTLNGVRFTDRIPPQRREEFEQWLACAENTERPATRCETTILPFAGPPISVEAVAMRSSFRGQDALQIICRDTTERKVNEEQLLKLRKAVESSGEIIFTTDVDGVFTFVNQEFENTYGFASNEIVGKVTPRILKSGTLGIEVYTHFWSAIKSGQVVKVQFQNRAKDGRIVDVEGSVSPIADDHGVTTGFLAVQRDITARKLEEQALKDSEENLRWLVSNIEEGILVVDPEDCVLFANKSAEDIFGRPQESLIGRSLADFMDEEEFELVHSLTKARREGVRNQYYMRIRRPNGEYRKLEVSAIPQFGQNGCLRTVVGSFRDVTSSGV